MSLRASAPASTAAEDTAGKTAAIGQSTTGETARGSSNAVRSSTAGAALPGLVAAPHLVGFELAVCAARASGVDKISDFEVFERGVFTVASDGGVFVNDKDLFFAVAPLHGDGVAIDGGDFAADKTGVIRRAAASARAGAALWRFVIAEHAGRDELLIFIKFAHCADKIADFEIGYVGGFALPREGCFRADENRRLFALRALDG